MIFCADQSANASTAGAAAVEITFDMVPNKQYQVTARSGDLWLRVVVAGATGTAAAQVLGSGSHFVPQGSSMLVAAIAKRTRVSIIRDGSTDVQGVLSHIATVVVAF